jgi:hypothetical protein
MLPEVCLRLQMIYLSFVNAFKIGYKLLARLYLGAELIIVQR